MEINLEKDEKYVIKSIDDLISCPLNMVEEALSTIKEALEIRKKLVEEINLPLSIGLTQITLTNDGKEDINVSFKV